MEPMTLGSAPSSPASPGINPNFLPGFLMGDNPPQTPTTPSMSTSPGRTRNSGSFAKLGMQNQDPRNLRQKIFNQSLVDTSGPQSPFQTISEKAGPPKQGLFDQLEQKKRPTSPIPSSTMAPLNESAVFNESLSRINDDSINISRNMFNANESLCRSQSTSRFERIDTLWVTVFGFPPSALTVVLAHMASCGPIADKKVPAVGNWVHIKYNSHNEVLRALSLNGKCINNSIMIGVALYNLKDNKENDNSTFTSPIRARSLRHSYVSPQNTSSVLSPQPLPQKSTGFVTKAMEYVFGW